MRYVFLGAPGSGKTTQAKRLARDYAIWLQVSLENLIERSTQRGRIDDHPEALGERLRSFESATQPLLEYYAAQKKLIIVQGDGDPESIQAEIRARLSLI